jgi:hypothetical protein
MTRHALAERMRYETHTSHRSKRPAQHGLDALGLPAIAPLDPVDLDRHDPLSLDTIARELPAEARRT